MFFYTFRAIFVRILHIICLVYNVANLYGQDDEIEEHFKRPRIQVGNRTFDYQDINEKAYIDFPTTDIPITLSFDEVILESGWSANVLFDNLCGNNPTKEVKSGRNIRISFTCENIGNSIFMVEPKLRISKGKGLGNRQSLCQLTCIPRITNNIQTQNQMVAKTVAPSATIVSKSPAKVDFGAFQIDEGNGVKHLGYKLFVNNEMVSGSNTKKEIACTLGQNIPIVLRLTDVAMQNTNAKLKFYINGKIWENIALDKLAGTSKDININFPFSKAENVNIDAIVTFTDISNSQYTEKLKLPNDIRLYDISLQENRTDSTKQTKPQEKELLVSKNKTQQDNTNYIPSNTFLNNDDEKLNKDDKIDNFSLYGLLTVLLLGVGIGGYHIYQKKQIKGKDRRGKSGGYF